MVSCEQLFFFLPLQFHIHDDLERQIGLCAKTEVSMRIAIPLVRDLYQMLIDLPRSLHAMEVVFSLALTFSFLR